MDTAGYSKWDGRLQEVPGGHWGRWGQRPLFLALTLVVVTVLWVLILSILFSKASTERGALLGHQDLLRTNVAQGLAEAGRDRENIRTELFRTLEGIRLGNSSCKKCPKSWLPFQGSCYLFSPLRATWVEAQHNCEGAGAHLVIVGGLDEQGFLSRNTQGRGYWLGLRAVRRARKIQGYQWADGVSLSFSYWNRGEPNDSLGREDCVMMLRTGMWNDAPCDSKDDSWICEKRHQC
ncbi:C-type lectin domain family 4 member G isoform X3 [Camelus ferus]|uniref:C-type lectin domain family 4 member G isoform X3 n=1 Tax=Camelus ferus TaxID=419612 RepID=A0A8B8RY00_CAMFR|nr:C-type lectin domain family 4 member G isoform X3 [Camelus ferus]